jgi:pyruvate/2-oxoglutarate dehydrogenase complex dihydrolipoamide acyltransferase (E2) component
MSEAARSRTAAVVLVALLGSGVLAGGIYWTSYTSGPDLADDLGSGDVGRMRSALLAADSETFEGEEGRERRRLTVETMRQMPVEDLMALWRSKDLTDEERELLGRNMRTIWMEHMNEMANEYLTATQDEEKVAILDRRIDEFMEFRNRMREYRESQEGDPEDEEASEQRREEMRRRWQSPTKEERRERAAQTNPDQQAKMIFMFRKMRERAQERGIDFGWGSGRGSGRGRGGDRGRDTQRGGDRNDDDRRGG